MIKARCRTVLQYDFVEKNIVYFGAGGIGEKLKANTPNCWQQISYWEEQWCQIWEIIAYI